MRQQEEAELQRRLNERRREQEEYESCLQRDREEREHEVLMARMKIQLETKEKELDMEKCPSLPFQNLKELQLIGYDLRVCSLHKLRANQFPMWTNFPTLWS